MAVAATGALTAAVKARFREQIRMTAIRIPKKEMTTHYMKLLSKYLFNKPRLRNVLEDPNDPNARLLLLEETLAESDLDSRQIDGAGPKTVAELIQVDGLQVTSAHVDVDYSYWPAHVVLRRLLPEGLEVPSSFESVGHIAHLNLREDLLPYKHVIGQVILDKNPRLKSVVNKVASIENEFRVFPMELLAGEDNMETEVRQHGARFKLDFKQVYANDLNPVSYKYLCTNISLNRLAGKVLPFNADGRAFIRQAAAGQLDLAAAETVLPADTKQSKQRNGQQKQQQKQQSAASTLVAQPDTQQQPVLSSSHPRVFHHIVMNLPASAVEFLDALNGSFCPQVWQGQQLPLVHVYAFAKGEQELAGVRARIEASLGGKLDEEPKQHVVRDVAPGKIMLCLTFRVPASVAFTNVMRQDKRQKTQG
ncbi:tRNA (guanine(37)-N1)-methyltransferase [Chlorella vulgaris]